MNNTVNFGSCYVKKTQSRIYRQERADNRGIRPEQIMAVQ